MHFRKTRSMQRVKIKKKKKDTTHSVIFNVPKRFSWNFSNLNRLPRTRAKRQLSLSAAGSDRSRVVTSKSHRRRVRDHLAAGVEKESQEIRLRNGRSLPTAVQLIAKINIHYCNYFLRRGRAESQDEGKETVENEETGGGGTRRNEEDAPTSSNLSPTV